MDYFTNFENLGYKKLATGWKTPPKKVGFGAPPLNFETLYTETVEDEDDEPESDLGEDDDEDMKMMMKK